MTLLPCLVCAFLVFLAYVYYAHFKQLTGVYSSEHSHTFALQLANNALQRANQQIYRVLNENLPATFDIECITLSGASAAFECGELHVTLKCNVRFQVSCRAKTPLVDFTFKTRDAVQIDSVGFVMRKRGHMLRITYFEIELACGPSRAFARMLSDLCKRIPGLEVPLR